MADKKKLKIAVLMGGESAERDVSLATGAGVIAGFRQAGHEAIGIDTALGGGQLSGPASETPLIKEKPPDTKELSTYSGETTVQTVSSPDLRHVDLVFIALHGGAGENGTVQALLDLLKIPYTGSGVLASAIAMDKLAAKKVVSASGIPTPDYIVKDSKNLTDKDTLIKAVMESVGFPVVVKPNDQGSSVGLDIVQSPEDLLGKARIAAEYSDRVLFERFIPGRELTVSILGDDVLPVAEVVPKDGFYDYHHKYTPGMADKIVPAPITEEETKKIQKLGMSVFKALGCKGYARIDFRMSTESEFYFLEANTLPGMTQTSLVPKAAKAAGIDFPELLDRIAQIAMEDFEKGKKA
jgi:D-alanine-D-alanine ligase